MKKKAVVLILGCALFMFNNGVFAYQSSSAVREYTGQVCSAGENSLCSAVTDELMKEMIKQTIYAVGTHVLNKYTNANNAAAAQTAAPAPAPAATTTTTTTSAVVQPTAPVTTTAPAVQTVSSPPEEMIIIQ